MKFDRWMKMLGAEGVRAPYSFASDDGTAVLFVDVNEKGRLRGWRFDE